MRTEICFEDEDVIVAYKPAGLATQSGRIGQADMVSELKKHLAMANRGKEPYIGLIHRLDQPVEGLLVFAKNQKAAAELNKQLAKGSLHKTYQAVLCGKPDASEGTLEDYLLKGKDNVAQISQKDNPEAKKAVLHYRVLKTVSLPENIFSLVTVTIETGRFHQIRVQMSHLGVPLLGDLKYGGDKMEELSKKYEVTNVGLCAAQVAFVHPRTGKKMNFTVEPKGKAFFVFS